MRRQPRRVVGGRLGDDLFKAGAQSCDESDDVGNRAVRQQCGVLLAPVRMIGQFERHMRADRHVAACGPDPALAARQGRQARDQLLGAAGHRDRQPFGQRRERQAAADERCLGNIRLETVLVYQVVLDSADEHLCVIRRGRITCIP